MLWKSKKSSPEAFVSSVKNAGFDEAPEMVYRFYDMLDVPEVKNDPDHPFRQVLEDFQRGTTAGFERHTAKDEGGRYKDAIWDEIYHHARDILEKMEDSREKTTVLQVMASFYTLTLNRELHIKKSRAFYHYEEAFKRLSDQDARWGAGSGSGMTDKVVAGKIAYSMKENGNAEGAGNTPEFQKMLNAIDVFALSVNIFGGGKMVMSMVALDEAIDKYLEGEKDHPDNPNIDEVLKVLDMIDEEKARKLKDEWKARRIPVENAEAEVEAEVEVEPEIGAQTEVVIEAEIEPEIAAGPGGEAESETESGLEPVVEQEPDDAPEWEEVVVDSVPTEENDDIEILKPLIENELEDNIEEPGSYEEVIRVDISEFEDEPVNDEAGEESVAEAAAEIIPEDTAEGITEEAAVEAEESPEEAVEEIPEVIVEEVIEETIVEREVPEEFRQELFNEDIENIGGEKMEDELKVSEDVEVKAEAEIKAEEPAEASVEVKEYPAIGEVFASSETDEAEKEAESSAEAEINETIADQGRLNHRDEKEREMEKRLAAEIERNKKKEEIKVVASDDGAEDSESDHKKDEKIKKEKEEKKDKKEKKEKKDKKDKPGKKDKKVKEDKETKKDKESKKQKEDKDSKNKDKKDKNNKKNKKNKKEKISEVDIENKKKADKKDKAEKKGKSEKKDKAGKKDKSEKKDKAEKKKNNKAKNN